MWTPIDIFYIAWFCNFYPCQEARLNVGETFNKKENKIITDSVQLRNDN